jgi:hypothetical protein
MLKLIFHFCKNILNKKIIIIFGLIIFMLTIKISVLEYTIADYEI